jgi:putative tryptophan/tyrosine transport system substrate-binding protein
LKRIRQLRVVALSIAMLSAAQWWCVNPAQAQKEPPARRIAVILVGQSQQGSAAQALRQGLRDAGYTEGRDVVLDWRSAQGNYGQVPAMVADIVRAEPDVIVVESTVAMAAVKEATSRIPIVMAVVADPVGSGFVQSLARPGGNITGLSVMMSDILTKRLQLLKEAIPGLKRLAVLRDPAIAWHSKAVEALAVAAKPMGVELALVAAGGQGEFERAFSASRKAHAQALYLLDNAFFFAERATILRLAAESNLPVATGGATEWVEDGAFLSYSADFTDMYRRAAGYVDSILKGANPKDLPIQQPTKFLLKVNLKTAKALGLKVP